MDEEVDRLRAASSEKLGDGGVMQGQDLGVFQINPFGGVLAKVLSCT